MSTKYRATVDVVYADNEEQTLDVSACSERLLRNTLAKLEKDVEQEGGEVLKVEHYTTKA